VSSELYGGQEPGALGGPRYCGDCGAPTPQHWPDCPTLQGKREGFDWHPAPFSNESPRRCPRCGKAMTRNHDQQSGTWTDNCTGGACGVTLEVAEPTSTSELPPDPTSPAAAFDAIAAMPGAQVFEEPYPGEGELCPSCQKPVRPETGDPYVQDGERFFHTGPCWTERLREAGP